MLFHTKTLFFVQVAEIGSFTKAAKNLFITPTAVMKQIDLFEYELGFQLFKRTRRGVFLTDAGESLYHDIKLLQKQEAEAVQRAKAIEQADAYVLRVGTSMLYPCTFLLATWSQLKQKYPEFRIQLVSINEERHNVMQNISLLGKEFDCIMSPLDSITCSSQCQFFQMTSCHFCITLPISHRLSKNTALSYQDLHGERLMLPPRGDHLIFDQVRNQIEIEHPQIHIIEGPFYHDLKLYCQCELANILLLTTSNTPSIQPSLKSIPLHNGLSVPYGLLYATHPSRIAEQFFDILKHNYHNCSCTLQNGQM